MGETTGISWTDKTWNPWQGCTKVSAGCRNCYMFREKKRYGQDPSAVVRSKPPTFNAPLKWTDPARVFTCSWSDFFHEAADTWRDDAWDIIRRTPHLTYQILTKRIERAEACLPPDWAHNFKHVWIGATVENNLAVCRIGSLSRIQCSVRFVSFEPLLEHLILSASQCVGIHWVIIGCESGGRDRRPCDLEWVEHLLKHYARPGIARFVKQIEISGRVSTNPNEWPEWARVRQFPS